jgi:hypothetical protein
MNMAQDETKRIRRDIIGVLFALQKYRIPTITTTQTFFSKARQIGRKD